MPRIRNSSKLEPPANFWDVLQGGPAVENFPLHTALWLYKNSRAGDCGAFGILPGPVLTAQYPVEKLWWKWDEEGQRLIGENRSPIITTDGRRFRRASRTPQFFRTLSELAWVLCLPAALSGIRRPSFGYERKGLFPLFLGEYEWEDAPKSCQLNNAGQPEYVGLLRRMMEPWLSSIRWIEMDDDHLMDNHQRLEEMFPPPTAQAVAWIGLFRACILEQLFLPLEQVLLLDEKIKAWKVTFKKSGDQELTSKNGDLLRAIQYIQDSMLTCRTELMRSERPQVGLGRGRHLREHYSLPFRGLPIFDIAPMRAEARRLFALSGHYLAKDEIARSEVRSHCGDIKRSNPFLANEDWLFLRTLTEKQKQRGNDRNGTRKVWSWLSRLYGATETSLRAIFDLSAHP